jgi:hypothetical protein
VQRHEQLVRAAKRLEDSIHQDAVATDARHEEVSTLEDDDKKLKETISHGREALAARNFEGAKTALAKAEFLHQLTVLSAPDNAAFVLKPLSAIISHELLGPASESAQKCPTPQTRCSVRDVVPPFPVLSQMMCCVVRAGLGQMRHVVKRRVDDCVVRGQVREAGNTAGPVQQRQERELKRFARDVVQVRCRCRCRCRCCRALPTCLPEPSATLRIVVVGTWCLDEVETLRVWGTGCLGCRVKDLGATLLSQSI